MQVLIDGLQIFSTYKEGIFLFILSALGLGFGAKRFLKTSQVQPGWVILAENFILGGLLLACLAYLLVVLGRIWFPIFTWGSRLIPLASVGLLLLEITKNRPGKLHFSGLTGVGILSLCFILFLLIRLAFLKNLTLPPYNDSPKHYEIVQSFLSPNVRNTDFYSLSKITRRYYHFGFHILAAWLSVTSGMGPADSISLLGQILICIAPISILWLAYVVTRKTAASVMAALFAGLAWQMPYFAVNWGKYPAIAGLGFFPAVLGLWYLYGRGKLNNWPNYLMLVILTTGLILIHTRLLICLMLAGGIYFLLERVFWKQDLNHKIVGILALLSLAVFGLFWDPLSNYYSNGYLGGLVLGAFLIPFAFQAHPRFSAGISLFALGVWLATRIPFMFQGHHLVLLDQPFVGTMLFIPLSLSIGPGFSGLFEKLIHYPAWRWGLVVSAAAILLLGFLSSNVLQPDSCCNYVKQADLEAFNWIKEKTQPSAVVWIAAIHNRDYMIGNDAGIWIMALTGRNSNKLPFDFDWSAPTARKNLCKKGYQEVYIYKGGTPYSFSAYALSEQNWLEAIYSNDEIIIYKVACDSTPGAF